MKKMNISVIIKDLASELAILLLILAIPTVLVVVPIVVSQQKAEGAINQSGENKNEKINAHPGKILILNQGDKTKKEFDAALFPDAEKFVYYRNGMPVKSPEEADTTVPVIEMEIVPRNDEGTIVPLEESTQAVIHYYGTQRKLLRTADFHDQF